MLYVSVGAIMRRVPAPSPSTGFTTRGVIVAAQLWIHFLWSWAHFKRLSGTKLWNCSRLPYCLFFFFLEIWSSAVIKEPKWKLNGTKRNPGDNSSYLYCLERNCSFRHNPEKQVWIKGKVNVAAWINCDTTRWDFSFILVWKSCL